MVTLDIERTQLFLPNLIEKFGQEKGKAIYNKMIDEYLSIRTIDQFNVKQGKFIHGPIGIPVSAIEQQLKMLYETKSDNEIPEHLRNWAAQKAILHANRIITKEITEYEDVLSRIRKKVNTYLISLEEEMSTSMRKSNGESTKSKNVFIIHGHDEAKWRELKEILKELGLNPIVLMDMPSSTMTVIEKFEHYAKDCSYAMAIFTPDDIVEKNGEKYFQARPNVIYEVGWFCGRLERNYVCIIFKESKDSEIFSDFNGIVQIRFIKNIREKISELHEELKAAGILE